MKDNKAPRETNRYHVLAPDEKREQPRAALLLRSAKLVGPSGEFLCIIRDISEGGVRIRTFHPVVGSEGMTLEVATGDRFLVEKVWATDSEAGFRFLHPVDVSRFIAEDSQFPKRPIRINLHHPVILRFNGRNTAAVFCDLSREGARIETAEHLAIDQFISISGEMLPEFEAKVCWRRRPHYGLALRRLMTMEEFALTAYRLQAGSPGSSTEGAA